MKKIISIITIVVLAAACTDRFEKVNKNPYRVSEESLAQDFNFGVRFATLFQNLTSSQTAESLATDTYARHAGIPTDFLNNRNNTTFYIEDAWNRTMWNGIYDNVMSPANVIKNTSLNSGLTLYAAWAELFQVLGLSRLTVYHGPVIYSDYAKEDKNVYYYDSEPELYKLFFQKLDAIYAEFKKHNDLPNGNPDKQTIAAKFDPTYGGNLAKWLRFINSMRLRLAMRIVKADSEWAQREGEKAIKDPAGLILTTADNFRTSLYGGRFNMWTIHHSWNDGRMSAAFEEHLVGYRDPRLYRWFEPVTGGAELYADHPNFPYKGIASGAYILAKDHRIPFSKLDNAYFDRTGNGGMWRRFLTAAEVNFILAEAVLRKWDVSGAGGKSAKEYYEAGIKESFTEWEIDKLSGSHIRSLADYLADDTSKPIDYVDPWDASPLYDGKHNSYKTRSTITIKWEEEDGLERKLERIMTQKWIDALVNANEVWSDHRRTGYPKLHFNPKNDSSEQWGVIGKEEFLRRMPFVLNERENNKEGVADAAKKMGGADLINTTLWIHTPWVNHQNPVNF